jgi:hypothetical protein
VRWGAWRDARRGRTASDTALRLDWRCFPSALVTRMCRCGRPLLLNSTAAHPHTDNRASSELSAWELDCHVPLTITPQVRRYLILPLGTRQVPPLPLPSGTQRARLPTFHRPGP